MSLFGYKSEKPERELTVEEREYFLGACRSVGILSTREQELMLKAMKQKMNNIEGNRGAAADLARLIVTPVDNHE